mgnify:CR=1 FL=1
MRPNQIEDDEEEEFRGPSKSHLKRVQNELQELGRVMTGMGDETLKKIGLPEDVYDEIIEYRRAGTCFPSGGETGGKPAQDHGQTAVCRFITWKIGSQGNEYLETFLHDQPS